jgi:hypothetical protein
MNARQQSRASEPNQFERHGRSVKVGSLLRVADDVIALMGDNVSDEEAARRFTRFRQEDRARVALLAGVNKPSELTWAAFVEAVRTRAEVPEVIDVVSAPHHETDADCSLGPDDCCLTCGVHHGEPCGECGGRGFHRDSCSAGVIS